MEIYFPDDVWNLIKEFRLGIPFEHVHENVDYDKFTVIDRGYEDSKGEMYTYSHKIFYKNEQLKKEQFVLRGKLYGITRCYYETGQLSAEYEHVNNLLHGVCISYYRDGVVMYIDLYDKGKLRIHKLKY